MAKVKRVYACEACGAQQPKWQGQCPDCGAWNSLAETRTTAGARAVVHHFAGSQEMAELPSIRPESVPRQPTGLGEFDRVLGGGLVPGGIVLMGGDPGIGKSTLLLQAMANIARSQKVCYVTGEESLGQIGMRAERLGVADAPLTLLAETAVEDILAAITSLKPSVVVIDSVQTLFTQALESAPGSVSQLREATAQLIRAAKRSATAVILVGHVTKEGTLAGPRVLEHMVDTVLYFESDSGSRFRIVRAVKNRFGAANELGVFAMTERGFREVSSPSAIFLARSEEVAAGSAITVTWEGSRPLLAELQALVDEAGGHPRRLAQGFDNQRLVLNLAILHRHAGVALGDRDVFANVVGGLKISEPALDLSVALAVLSSFRDQPLPRDMIFFGELGLTGEVRPVPYGSERIATAAQHGFRRALVPAANKLRSSDVPDIELIPVKGLVQAIDAVF